MIEHGERLDLDDDARKPTLAQGGTVVDRQPKSRSPHPADGSLAESTEARSGRTTFPPRHVAGLRGLVRTGFIRMS
ncbi:hypothetical protein DYI37_02860 [Fulvimarina endophytica]|uniref:Uncharacterized protein n=1 Tax=Fulvimarina endophytica TaxID=2293836 RepID=A0A371XB11_9HYPH|nr:hypothetical protein DYI37_02860 [Fulvimarina endophytica]